MNGHPLVEERRRKEEVFRKDVMLYVTSEGEKFIREKRLHAVEDILRVNNDGPRPKKKVVGCNQVPRLGSFLTMRTEARLRLSLTK